VRVGGALAKGAMDLKKRNGGNEICFTTLLQVAQLLLQEAKSTNTHAGGESIANGCLRVDLFLQKLPRRVLA